MTNIFSSFVQPVRSIGDYMDEAESRTARRNQNALQALTLSQTRQQIQEQAEERAALAAAYQGGGDIQGALRSSGRAGLIQHADARDKAKAEQDKSAAGIANEKSGTVVKHLTALGELTKGVMANPTQQTAMQALDQWQAMTGQDGAADRAAVMGMTDPQQVRQWAMGKALKAAEMLPKFAQINTGKQTVFVDQNAATNPDPQPLTMGTTPGQDQSDATARAGQAITMRGQNMVDARTREGHALVDARTREGQALVDARARDANDAAKSKAAAGGKSTEGERNAAGYGLRMDRASKLLDDLEKDGRPGYGTNIMGALPFIGGAARTAVMNDKQQQYRQAQEDWVRAKLRKESGAVIGADEMQAEILTYFPQPGEHKGVIAQKRAARKTAEQAMSLSAGGLGESVNQGGVVDFGSLK